MWNRLEAGDIDRARQSLRERRAETVNRHDEEMKNLQLRQDEEILKLNAKEAEIELLNQLIDSFSEEFQYTPPGRPVELGEEFLADSAPIVVDEDVEGEAENDAGSTPEAVSSGNRLAVGYASPNFARFRKLAS
jgi:hypothetical protein